jgi:sialate O-acetylesterase
MVLQRAPQRSIVWGYADTFNTPITLTMNNKAYHTISSPSSSADSADESIWSLTLDAQTEEGPFQVKVTQTLPNGTLLTITLDDVLFGDVWLCSGQSNMQFSVSGMFNASVEIANANNYPKIRLFTLVDRQAFTPQEEPLTIGMNWSVASNATVASGYTSAVCWLYGRMVQEGLGGRPIGLIHTSWGGTDIEYWTPPEVLKDCGITRSVPILKEISIIT